MAHQREEHPRLADSVASVRRHEAIVIGAGPAGLSTAAELSRQGFETVVVEKADVVGARWRARYDELRLNSWRFTSNLQRYKMPRSLGRYPGRDDFVAYLERYAAYHRIQLEFNTELVHVERDHEMWRLETSSGDMLARYLVIATGWDALPRLPIWAGGETYAGELIHSSDFRGASAYGDRKVLIVGAGNSGIDIGLHLVAAGARVTVSMRTPPNLASRELFGIPGQPMLLLVGDHVPYRVADLMGTAVQRLLFGDLTRYGIPRAREGMYAAFRHHMRNPAIDDGFIDALKRGHAHVVAEVERLDGRDVVLVDGTRVQPDAVICATGYRRGLEPLVGHLGVLRADGVPWCHSGAPEHPAAPRLYFAGMWGQFSGQIRLGPIHARRIARAMVREHRRASHAIT